LRDKSIPLSQELPVNRRNGKSKKTIKSLNGNFELSTGTERDCVPQFAKKHQTTLSDEIEGEIIALDGLGVNYKDISFHLQEMLGWRFSLEPWPLCDR